MSPQSAFSIRPLIVLPILAAAAPVAAGSGLPPSIGTAIDFAESQARAMLDDLGYGEEGNNPDWGTNPEVFAKVTTNDSGNVDWAYKSAGGNWGAGFTPGLFWDLYVLTGDGYWETKAREWTDGVRNLTGAGGDMRMNLGFHFMNSFARKIAHGGESGDEAVMAAAADALEQSWMPEVGSFYSFTWNRGFRYDGLQGGFSAYSNAIIDSAPNMEIALHQAKREADADLWAKGISHLENLIRDNIRADGSTGQLADYDTETGEFLGWRGHQGYGPETTWSRGQGWALHGMASAWRETTDPRFGDVFHELYLYYRDYAPEDGVPYWDFDAPLLTAADLALRYPNEEDPESIVLSRDSSAAALAASGLLEAVVLAETDQQAQEYFRYAEKILLTLSQPGYLAMDETGQPQKESILRQGSYTFPGVDKGQIWGDFFFVEALRRYRDLVAGQTTFAPGEAGDLAGFRSLGGQRHWQVRRRDGDWRLWGVDPGGWPAETDAEQALLHADRVNGFGMTLEVIPEHRPEDGGEVEFVFIFDYRSENDFHFIRFAGEAARRGVFRKTLHGEETVFAGADLPGGESAYTVEVERTAGRLILRDSAGIPLLDGSLAAPAGGFYWGFAVANGSAWVDLEDLTRSGATAVEQPYERWLAVELGGAAFPMNLPGADADGDGWTNEEEYLLLGNPSVADGPVPGLRLRAGGPGAVELVFPWNASRNDVRYVVEKRVTAPGSWEPVREMRPEGGADSWSERVETVSVEGERSFWRLRLERGLAR